MLRPFLRLFLFFLIAVLLLWSGVFSRCVGIAASFVSGAAGSLGKQTVIQKMVWSFWYPSLLSERQQGRRTGDTDPSYQRYIETRELQQDYERLLRTLGEHSRLFSEEWSGGNFGGGIQSEAGQKSGSGQLSVGAADFGTLTEFGNVAGETLLADSAGGGLNPNGVRYMAEQLADYDFLMKHFYTVHPTAAAGRELMRAADFLETDLSLETETAAGSTTANSAAADNAAADASGPQILIYHTHSQEEYADYHQGNTEATIVNVGSYLARLLEEKGYRVYHDTSVYDVKDGTLDRSQAYNYALEGVTAILQKYPSIQVILDLHRDGVAETTRLITEVGGKQTASIMFFNGTCETPDGLIEYLPNPYRTENLAFSFQMKLCAEALYPGFTRNIYLKGLRYNQHLRPRSALIEVGAQNNTYEEALNAMEPLSELLDLVLKEKDGE